MGVVVRGRIKARVRNKGGRERSALRRRLGLGEAMDLETCWVIIDDGVFEISDKINHFASESQVAKHVEISELGGR